MRGGRAVLARRRARPGTAPAPPPGGTRFLRGGNLGCRLDWRRRSLGDLGRGGRPAASAPSRRGRSGWDPFGGRLAGCLSAASDACSDLTLGAERPVSGMDVHAPHHDRGGRAAHRGPLLGERPARVDCLAGPHRPWELPVHPLPFGYGGNGHIHRPQPNGDGDQERRGGEAGPGMDDVDREGGEIARHRGEQRDLRLRDGAPPGRPLAAEGQVVERDRLQVGSEYSGIKFASPGVNLGRLQPGRTYCSIFRPFCW